MKPINVISFIKHSRVVINTSNRVIIVIDMHHYGVMLYCCCNETVPSCHDLSIIAAIFDVEDAVMSSKY